MQTRAAVDEVAEQRDEIGLLRRHFIPSREGPRFRAGLVERDGRLLFVTSGVGVTGIPARLFALPEIAVLELHPL